MLVNSGEKRDLEVRRRSKDNLEETELNPAAAPASSQPVPEKGNGAGLEEGHTCSQNQPATATVSGAPATQVNPHNPNPAAGVPLSATERCKSEGSEGQGMRRSCS